ncbi:Polyprenyl synthetase [Corchorus capsularis]|uniref:Polyprenyl synthetase n=1 Tax=Corchorus capsularis TaxID=210143 RepID=A0A1R3JYF3_COCAP|nr:Polyprenyl synthetase [Corchorus capsularis]
MIDVMTTLHGEKYLSKYSLSLHRRIVQYKTAYYSFYLPDDFQDCFGDPVVIGKVRTDIEDFKCSWLVVKALERANEEILMNVVGNVVAILARLLPQKYA